MPTMPSISSSSSVVYSFATNRHKRETVQVVETTTTTKENVLREDDGENGARANDNKSITFDILQVGLSANNKFYLDFGDKAPFNFNKCYPIDEEKSKILGDDDDDVNVSDYVHPPVWGLCRVQSSHVDSVTVGSHYLAQLPMAESVTFEQGGVVTKDEEKVLMVHRPATHASYNAFQPVAVAATNDDKSENSSIFLDKDYGALALVCFPGIITGFGLYFDLKGNNFFDGKNTKNHVVITAASSKVGLALALYLKKDDSPLVRGRKVIGYTSAKNKEFVQKTGLYDVVLGYSDTLKDALAKDDKIPSSPSSSSCVMIDISGKAALYKNNSDAPIVKLLCIGNASAMPDADSTFSCFGRLAMCKMILTMAGAPKWMRSWIPAAQELFLIMDVSAALKQEWGVTKYQNTMEDYTKLFCREAASTWGMTVRECTTEKTIQQAFVDIVQGSVPPSEAIVLDVSKAVEHRHRK